MDSGDTICSPIENGGGIKTIWLAGITFPQIKHKAKRIKQYQSVKQYLQGVTKMILLNYSFEVLQVSQDHVKHCQFTYAHFS